MRKFELPWSWRMYVAFCLLAYLAGAAHEIAHHLTGYLTSGQFGRMSFTLFESPDANRHAVWASLAGPVVTFLTAGIGALLVWRGRRPILGFSLIAASHSFMRIVGVVGRGGDESAAAKMLFGYLPYWQLVALEILLVVPPIAIAFLALTNKHRLWVFASSIFGPFLPLIAVKFVDDRWFTTFVNSPENFHQPVAFGMPIVVLIAHLLAVAIFAAVGARVLTQPSQQASYVASR